MSGIAITNGTVAYRTDTGTGYCLALQKVDLDIAQGEFVAIVGPNGSGKSTLARVISHLLPLSKGTISWSDRWSNFYEDAGPVQMVFQNPDAQILGETVFEDVCFGLENFSVPAEEMPDRAKKALDLVGFNAHYNQPVNNLSGGQKQLLCIASCIAVGAQVLVFDEATAMLNPAARRHIFQLAQKLQREGITVIWVTQWMEEAAESNRIIALQSGEILFDGTPMEFFYGIDGGSPSLPDDNEVPHPSSNLNKTPCESLQLKPPYAVEVAHALTAAGTVLRVPPLTIQELSEGVQQLCQLH